MLFTLAGAYAGTAARKGLGTPYDDKLRQLTGGLICHILLYDYGHRRRLVLAESTDAHVEGSGPVWAWAFNG
jgi:hypothetical protein